MVVGSSACAASMRARALSKFADAMGRGFEVCVCVC